MKGATEERTSEFPEELQKIQTGKWVYIKVFKRKWNEPKREGPFRVILTSPTALKVEGKRQRQGSDIGDHLQLATHIPLHRKC